MNTSEYTEKLMALANKELFGDEKMQLEKEIQELKASGNLDAGIVSLHVGGGDDEKKREYKKLKSILQTH